MDFFTNEYKAALKALESSPEGLSGEEARLRLIKLGPNKLEEAKSVSLLSRFAKQLSDPMIIILLVAAALSAVTSIYEGESLADVFIILAVVIINAVLGVYQESKAEKAIEALQGMMAPTSAVIRGGHLLRIPSEEIVPGDVLALEAGDAVPADARIIENASLQVEEAALTGESVPVTKTADALSAQSGSVPLGDRKNMVYMGGTVVYGRGRAVVTGTGMQTEMGKIAGALAQAEEQQTPLQRKLSQLSRILSIVVLSICAFIFIFSLIRTGDFSTAMVVDTFMIAVSLAVAAIPEGLAAVVTVVLSIGVTRMSKRSAVIRKLTAVETLGCAQIICSDKTGTLTQNRMTVVEHRGADEGLLARAMALCSDAEWEGGVAVGEPTESALVTYAAKLNMPKGALVAEAPRVGEAPFDSMRKMMTTLHSESGGVVQYTKGAPDEVIARCTHVLRDGEPIEMTDALRAEILLENKQMADRALRVLAAATRRLSDVPKDTSPDVLEKGLTFVGLVGMIDPVRPEVKAAIDECYQAGIRPVMITGDHRDTAIAIAQELGIITDASQAITGTELSQMDDVTFEKRIAEFSVYARVQPVHKVRIVETWQKLGKIVAMTGDGVNDAPSIKRADIGVGMGITGTDVTKNVADMVLADDNFATIVKAVEEGRRIYDNIRKSIQFLLASNLSEVLAIFTATMLGFTILQPAHILWINLITDTFPALALGMEPAERDLMERPPRGAGEGIFSGGVGFGIAYQGVLVTLVTLAAYFIGHYMESGVWEIANSADGMTMAFLTLSMAEIFHSYNLRSQIGSIFTLKHHNLYLFGAMIASFILTTGVIYIPALADAFAFQPITLAEYFVAIALALSVIPVVEVVKAVQRHAMKKRG